MARARQELIKELAESRARIATLENLMEALHSDRDRLSAIFEAVHDGLAIIDGQRNIVYVNSVLESVFGAWAGRKCYAYFCQRERICPQCRMREVLEGEVIRRQWHCRDKGLTYELIDTPLKNPDGGLWMMEVFRDVTDREEAVEALRHHQEQYRSTIDSMIDAMHVVDRDLRIVLMNKAFLEWHQTLGLDSDVMGRDLFGLYPFLAAKVRGEYRTVFETGRPLTTQEVNRIGDKVIYTETRKIPVLDEGKVTRVVTIVRDITEWKKSEQALRESEEKFRILAERSPNMIFINCRNRIVYVNQKCVDVTGYSREEFYAPSFDFFRLIAPDSIEAISTAWARHLEGQEIEPHEYGLVTRNGRRIEALLTTQLIEYRGQTALLGVVTDITDRNRAEAALRVSEEKHRSFVENFHGIAYRGGLDGTPIFFLGDVERITGYSQADFLSGKPRWGDIIHPDDRKKEVRDGRQQGPFAEEYRGDREYRIVRRDGTIRWIHQSLKPVYDEQGTAVLIQGALYDVTARKRAEDDLKRERGAFRIIAEAALHGRDIKTVSEKVLRGLVEALGFDYGNLRLYEARSQRLKVIVQAGTSTESLMGKIQDQALEDQRYITAYVARSRSAVFAPDVSRDKRLVRFRRRLDELRMESVICWPLLSSHGDLLGVMNLAAHRPKEIPESDRGFFQTVAEMFGIVLERMWAENGLWESEARYRSRFEDSPIPLWEEDFSAIRAYLDSLEASGITDFDSYLGQHPEELVRCAEMVRVIDANRAALELYATETIQEFERVVRANIGGNASGVFRNLLVSLGGGSTGFELELTARTADGEERFLQLRWSAAPGYEKTLAKVLVSVIDLTERKEAEEIAQRAEIQLRRYSEELEQMVVDRTARIRELERQRAESEKLAATGRMAARIAHEINNPLAGIKNSFRLLKDIMDKQHPHYQYAQRVEREIDRVAHIIRRMFDLYRPDAEKMVQMSVSEAIRDVAGIMETSCRAAGVSLRLEIPQAPIRAALPPGYMNQILLNLIQNSLEASGPGGEIVLGAAANRSGLVIKVKDRGRGIDPKIGRQVFEPFFTTKEETGAAGLGLGLSVTKGMVEAMGGSIDFESNPSWGTIFTVRLPLWGKPKEV